MNHKAVRVLIWLLLLLMVSTGYRWFTIPPVEDWSPHTLALTPYSEELFSSTLATEPWRMFLPMDHGDGGRYAWNTAKSLPVYYLSKILSPVSLYLLLSGIMVTALYFAALITTRSLRFAVSLGLIAALSTFLSYALVYGSLMRNFLFIAYIAIAAIFLVQYLRSKRRSWTLYISFVVASLFVILSGEHWLNLALSLLLGFGFIYVWAKHHAETELPRRIGFVAAFLIGAMVFYLGIRMQYVQSYTQPGFENEMVFTYSSFLLMVEDVVVNYFTYVHITLSGMMPGFLSFSPSYTELGAETILAEQQGYHAQYTQLVVSSHLTSWRFVAGMMLVGLFLCGWKWIRMAWKSRDPVHLVAVILFIIVATGFATYLPIKMRPMHLTAMLGYKTIMSSTALMVLVAWLVDRSATWSISRRAHQGFVGLIFGFVVMAAFTRPATQTAGLEAVGLDGVGDPLGRLLHHDDTG